MAKTRRRTRKSSGSSISKAWKARKRKKEGLVQRTVTANRRAISSLRKAPEVKEMSQFTCVPNVIPDYYPGQQFRVQADNQGLDNTGTPVIINPLYLKQGSESFNRLGDWVTMTSLSYHVQFNAETGPTAASSNRVGMIVVLDTEPMGTAVGAGVKLYNTAWTPTLSDSGQLLDPQGTANTSPWLMYKDKDNTTGPSARFKILRHHKGIIQPQAAGSVRFNSVVFSGSIVAPYKFVYQEEAILPSNQRILLFLYSDSASLPAPAAEGYCRFRFRDE